MAQTDRIYGLLKELSRCDYTAFLLETEPIEAFCYNGVPYSEGAEGYNQRLQSMFDAFKSDLLSLIDNPKFDVLRNVLVSECAKIQGQYYDIPTDETIAQIAIDLERNNSKSLKKSLRSARFLKEMVGVQKYYLGEVQSFLGQFSDIGSKQPTVSITPRVTDEDEDDDTIKGVKGLADYLGCGTTKAQAIVKSGIFLQLKNGTQWEAGGWRFSKKKIQDFLNNNPTALEKIKCPH